MMHILRLLIAVSNHRNSLRAGVESDFVPWLMDSVDEQLCRSETSRKLLDALIRDVVSSRKEQFDKLAADEARGTPTAAAAAADVADDEPATEAFILATGMAPIKEESGMNQEVGQRILCQKVVL
jgi:hypothetical protein